MRNTIISCDKCGSVENIIENCMQICFDTSRDAINGLCHDFKCPDLCSKCFRSTVKNIVEILPNDVARRVSSWFPNSKVT